jgi:NAD(P)-dependent dehydrogenase (short-subunit alcohol dehydrogenase family)
MIAVVAGGCGLIGSAIIRKFARIGIDAISFDVSPEAYSQVDVFDGAAFKSEFGKLYEVGNPSIFIDATYPDELVPNKAYSEYIESVARQMYSRHCGSIVLISSIYGNISNCPENYIGSKVISTPLWYGMTKAGTIQLTRMLAVKYAPVVRVNCVSPGGVFDNQDKVFVNRYLTNVPLRRMALPDEVAGPVCFLAGDDASYITGANLIVDGGLCAL